LALSPLQLGLGPHELLRGGIQRRARGRGIKLALGLAPPRGRDPKTSLKSMARTGNAPQSPGTIIDIPL
jgi:hypothetical protein